jgi:hypothetical protein
MNSRLASSLLVILSIPDSVFAHVDSAALSDLVINESKAVLRDVIRNATPV